jgi:hypothetical protein
VDDQFRAAFQELKGAHVRPNPSDYLLILAGFRVGVVAGAEYGHEQ